MAPVLAFATTVALLWLICMMASVVAFRWSICRTPKRFWVALILSFIVVVISYGGLERFHFTYSRTVNGSGWSVDSKWFFLASLLMGAVSLGLALWNRKKWDLAKPSVPPVISAHE